MSMTVSSPQVRHVRALEQIEVDEAEIAATQAGEHRPLGSIDRVLRLAYAASGRARAQRNGLPFDEGGWPFEQG